MRSDYSICWGDSARRPWYRGEHAESIQIEHAERRFPSGQLSKGFPFFPGFVLCWTESGLFDFKSHIKTEVLHICCYLWFASSCGVTGKQCVKVQHFVESTSFQLCCFVVFVELLLLLETRICTLRCSNVSIYTPKSYLRKLRKLKNHGSHEMDFLKIFFWNMN